MSTSDIKVRTQPANVPGIRHADDLYGWVQQQMKLLQAGEVDKVDATRITQELADMGRSEFRRLVSAIRLVVHHLLKWDHQPSHRSLSWAITVQQQRRNIGYLLVENPSLKSRVQAAIQRAYSDALGDARKETGLPANTFPPECPYLWDDITLRPIDWDDEQSR